MITYGHKFNRSFGLYLPFKGDHISVEVFFHKSNTHLGFSYDEKVNRMARDNEIKTAFYKDLKQSSFAENFLDIRNVKSSGLDIRNQFCNIIEEHKSKIFYVTNESVKLHKIHNPNNPKKPFESCLYVYAFSFSDYEDDFLYILAERHHIDTSINKKLVRTSSVQISTNDCYDNLKEFVKSNKTEDDDHNEYMSNSADIINKTLSDVFNTEE